MIDTFKKTYRLFTPAARRLWLISASLVLLSFLLFDRANYLTLAASLIGVTSLIFNAAGHPFGQLLMIIFSIIYGVISYSFAYYGEMITYLGMTGPMALFALISWIRHPFSEGRSEVRVNTLGRTELIFAAILTAAVTAGFYFILDAFHTANIFFSTVSVATSFLAVYLTFRRSAAFPLAYAANDIVLIILWTYAALDDPSYISVIVCFAVFLVNDIYGFISWGEMRRRQAAGDKISRRAGTCAVGPNTV